MTQDDSFNCWLEIWDVLEAELLPAAIKLRCFPPGTKARQLLFPRLIVGWSPSKLEVRRRLSTLARTCLIGMAKSAGTKFDPSVLGFTGFTEEGLSPGEERARKSRILKGLGITEEALERLATARTRGATAAMSSTGGYMQALEAVGRESSERAAAGRRKIGVETKTKVRGAAMEFRSDSKEQAALRIAERLNLSPATVRKLLSQLYPGTAWGKSADADGNSS